MDEASRHPFYVDFSVSAVQVLPGHSVMLHWKIVGIEAPVASVHLSSGFGGVAQMIERVAVQGEREIIFAHTGAYAFCLTATFGNGAKCVREAQVQVENEEQP